MKNYLKGFGVIMAVGLAFALSGSNGASTMLATLLSTASSDTTKLSVDATTTTLDPISLTGLVSNEITEPTINSTSSGTASSTQSTTEPTDQKVVLLAPTANQILQGDQVLNVYAGMGLRGVKFQLVNVQTNDRSIVDATCVDNVTEISGTTGRCIAEIHTIKMPNGKYSVGAQAVYIDGSVISSNQVFVYINNPKPTFIFAPIPTPVSGTITIGGTVSAATEVEFLYKPLQGVEFARIGTGMYAGGVTQSKWTYEWDTTLVPNGAYKVIANIKSQYGSAMAYKGGETTVTIFNAIILDEPIVHPTTTDLIVAPIAATLSTTTTTTTTTEPNAEDFWVRVPEQIDPQPRVAAPSIEQGAGEFKISVPERIIPQPQQRASGRNIGTQIAPQPRATQVAPISQLTAPTVPVPPVVQRIQDIAIGLQSGSDPALVEQKVEALQKELWGDVDPANPAVRAKMQYQSAKKFGTIVDTTVMRVADIALSTTTEEAIVSVATTTTKGEKVIIEEKKIVVKEKVRLTGKALPNTYITLYIYSEIPTIAVVKADRSGNWVYELDSKLDDGRHEAYVTINDSTGKVIAKSPLFGFVKTAEALTVENKGLNLGDLSDEPIQPVQAAKRTYALIVFTIIGGGLAMGVFLIVHSFKSKKQDLI